MNNIVNSHIDEIYNNINDLIDELYIVGGYVRDNHLNRKTFDVDISLKVKINQMENIFNNLKSQLNYSKIEFVDEFANIRIQMGHYNYDVVPFRKEFYVPNSYKPSIKSGTFIDDLLRRDFTVNSIYKKYIELGKYNIIDPLHGLSDIDNHLIRLNYSGSFADDPTRMLRMFTYKHRLGFEVEDNTISEIKNAYMKKIPLNALIVYLIKILKEEKNELILNDIISYQLLTSIGLINPCEIGERISLEDKMLEILSKNPKTSTASTEKKLYKGERGVAST